MNDPSHGSFKPDTDGKRWPEVPYKGFSYYGPGDIPLFAGRDKEIIEFAEFVADSATRLVLLQGATGCGKSSFLRAGVIPFLEGAGRGYEFQKAQADGQPRKAIFIRSSDLPLQRLAEEIFRFASTGYSFESPAGLETIDLKGTLRDFRAAEEFAAALSDAPELLVQILRDISSEIPSTLVLVIDQGEEALTLGDDPMRIQAAYFRFLSLFTLSEFPLKLIISLRTDYFGQFLNAISRSQVANPRLRQFLLSSLERPGLIAAIERPTLPERQGVYPPPPYGFQFEDGLPEIIADDLIDKTREGGLTGGELPVLQVVCETLYKNTCGRAQPWTISRDDYLSLGHIEIQLSDYVDRYLVDFCKDKKLDSDRTMHDVSSWKDALVHLVRVQANNALTSDVKTLDQLTRGVDASARERFAELLDYLSRDDVGVLRAELVKQIKSTQTERSFSLRHDAVGLVLKRWREAREATDTTGSIFPLFSRLTSFVYLAFGAVGLFIAGFSSIQEMYREATLLAGGGFLLLSVGIVLLTVSNRSRKLIGSQVVTYRQFLMFGRIWPLSLVLRKADDVFLSSLQQDPVFRLLIKTDPIAEARLQKLQGKLGG